MAYIVFSSWAVGILNGYNKDNNPLDKSIPYSILAMTNVMTAFKVIGSINKPVLIPATIIGSFIGATILTGGVYCSGNFLGKALKHTINTPLE